MFPQHSGAHFPYLPGTLSTGDPRAGPAEMPSTQHRQTPIYTAALPYPVISMHPLGLNTSSLPPLPMVIPNTYVLPRAISPSLASSSVFNYTSTGGSQLSTSHCTPTTVDTTQMHGQCTICTPSPWHAAMHSPASAFTQVTTNHPGLPSWQYFDSTYVPPSHSTPYNHDAINGLSSPTHVFSPESCMAPSSTIQSPLPQEFSLPHMESHDVTPESVPLQVDPFGHILPPSSASLPSYSSPVNCHESSDQ